MRDFPLKSEQEIDKALIHLPFEIQAKSLQEKISANFTRLSAPER